MTKRENDAIWTAAEKANRQCGQWMPQRWIEIFIKELASAPPATSAGVGADEIARALANSLGMDLDEEERMAARGHSPSQNYLNEWNKYANAILALLSRAGESDQK